MFFPPVFMGYWCLQSSSQTGTRPLPILGVFKPKPVAITQAQELFQDDGREEGAISLQHASREQLQPSQVVVIQSSNLLQDLVRNPQHTSVSTGSSARAPESAGKPWRCKECAFRRHYTHLWAGRMLSLTQPGAHGLNLSS